MENGPERIIERFKKRKVLVIGDAILDTYIKGTTDRLCREAPVPVLNVLEQEHSCGGAANTAINLAALGAQTYFLTVTGRDDNSRFLMEQLRRYGVHTGCIVRAGERATIAKKRLTAAGNILLRLDEGATAPVTGHTEAALLAKIRKIYPTVHAVILSDYGYGVLTDRVLDTLAELGIAYPKPLVVDSRNLPRFRKLHPAAVKPNYEEALQLLGLPKAADRVAQLLGQEGQLLERTGAACVAATLDADGALVLRPGQRPVRIDAVPRDNKNSIGAGDTFISAMTLALACGQDGRQSAELGAAAAAVIMQKEGTAVCTNEELKACFRSNPKRVYDLKALAELVRARRQAGKRVVFTNGCFDILHTGHVTLLNKARALGDLLIVGINSDASIRKVKGEDRPINTLEDRLMVLSALQSVDYLVSFDEDTAVSLVEALRPDLFVKGATYSGKTPPEASVVEGYGGQVVIFPPFSDGSTARLIEKIRGGAPRRKTVRDKDSTAAGALSFE
jgi:D-beta-D-heptose 7-phosphate kinase/D-beta-D-heptose 1-phosphate adenosyltransferase